ncbi:dihydroxyacetone kinase-like protein [Murinocardiopsis flavida]|uniref:Dihydroxyacetone kinase-like protein n=1 Tax=Murinocardiopsis flavida TaxID=645275 RepID=A0A2P8D534_9ACTN|nr:dihydroxyacetone kinase subunit DhaL [Murinocardiopsis flavida]PSK92321.1 dihydroxyacetone kinase-like protein [Murinocardiopsis flavida]
MDIKTARAWVRAIAASVEAGKDRLTRLDSAIGDADHGNNLHRGFTAVDAALATHPAATPGDVLVTTGSTLISKVGGASGPLYGSLFRAAGKRLTQSAPTPADLADALDAGLAAVRKLGSAQVGDKTMVDALTPALEALRAAAESGADLPAAAHAAAKAAADGAASTIPLQARKGRASYLGQRSQGHEDPGAASTAMIFTALAEAAG